MHCYKNRNKFVPLDQQTCSKGITIQHRTEEESRAFHSAFEEWKKPLALQGLFEYRPKLFSCNYGLELLLAYVV